jgi:hypothetical protein
MLTKLTGALGPVVSAIGTLAGPVILVGGALAAAAGGLFLMGGGMKKLEPAWTKIKDAFGNLTEKIQPFADKLADAAAFVAGKVADGFAWLIDKAAGTAGALARFLGITDEAAEAEKRLAKANEAAAKLREQQSAELAKVIEAEAAAARLRFERKQEQGEFNEIVESKQAEAERRRKDLGIEGKGPDMGDLKIAGADLKDRRAEAVKDLAAMESRLAEAQKLGGEAATKALAARDDAARRLLELEKQHLKVTEDRGRRAIDDLVRQRDEQRKLLDEAKTEADRAAEKLQAAQEKFAGLDPFEQQRVREAKQALDRGETLDSDQARRLKDLGLFDEQVQQSRADEGAREDVGGVVFGEAQKDVERKQAQAKEAERLFLESKSKVEVEVKHNEDLVKQIMDAMRPQVEKLAREQTQAAETAAQKLARELAERRMAESSGRKK